MQLVTSMITRKANISPINMTDTTPIETEEGRLSSALVFLLIVADSRFLFKLSLSVIISNFSAVVKLANSGSNEKFLNRFVKS